MNVFLIGGTAALLAIWLAAVAWRTWRGRHDRHASLQRLLDLADRLEADLKTCRQGLQQAHAVMSHNPDLPAASEQDARHAIDAGLRGLLQQRLWIRDHADKAKLQQLEQAARSMQDMRTRLQPLLDGLTQAQHALNSAMREHITRDTNA